MDWGGVLWYFLITMADPGNRQDSASAHDLVFLHGMRTPRCTATVDKHFDGYFTLQCMTEGVVDLFYDREHHRLEGGWCWTAFPGPWIRFRRAEGCPWWHHRYIAVRGPLVLRWVAEGLLFKGVQRNPPDPDFIRDFDRLHVLMQHPDRWSHRRAVGLLEGLLLQLAQGRAAGAAEQPWLERVLARLAEPEDYSVERLSREAGMAPSTLRRRFREATGTSLHAHALACRLGSARRLLTETDLPVKAIAERLGYADLSFFTRQFRQHVGMPPAAYRTSHR